MKYSKEFKDSTVQLILHNNESTVKVASDLDLNPQTLYNWIRAYRKEHNMPMRDIKTKNPTETLHEENKRLRHELKIAKQERDILKKAAAYFAKETL
jgi:transposase